MTATAERVERLRVERLGLGAELDAVEEDLVDALRADTSALLAQARELEREKGRVEAEVRRLEAALDRKRAEVDAARAERDAAGLAAAFDSRGSA